MADPTYRIYYGKYPDLTPNEIPTAHIREVNFPSYKIEPGKPGEPKVASLSFTLENFNHDGSERYDRAWVEANSRTEGEGATLPDQLFFKVVVTGTNIEYVGVLSGTKYDAYRTSVSFTIKSIFDFIKDSNLVFLKPFKLTGMLLDFADDGGSGSNPRIPLDGYDLEGNDISISILKFSYPGLGYKESGLDVSKELSTYLAHLGWNPDHLNPPAVPDGADISTDEFTRIRQAYIQIGETTLLTEVNESFTKYRNTSDELYIDYRINIIEARNGNITINDNTTLERGRFFINDEVLTDDDIVDIIIWDYDFGNDPDIIRTQNDTPHSSSDFAHGVPYEIESDKIQLQNTDSIPVYFNVMSVSIYDLNQKLLTNYYSGSPSLFDYSKASSKFRYAFYSDVSQFGWIDNSISDFLVDLSIQTNSYLFISESGKIVFQNRLLHEDILPGTLPLDAFEIQLEDIKPLGSEDDSKGFTSYEITYNDILEINNQRSEQEFKAFVSKDGELSSSRLRNSSLEVKNYRTSNLGVPGSNDPEGMPVFRYSPEDAAFPGLLDLDDFIPDPITQAQNFAKSFSYPVEIWDIQIPMLSYPYAGIGKYCWVERSGLNKVYFIREFHPNPDQLTIGIKAQFVGVYEP